MAKSNRPNRLHPGAPLSEHYQIEGLVRLAEQRMFYLANDDRQDQPKKFCWDCGETETPRTAQNCIQCGCSMRIRKFLICMRWDAMEFEHYEAFFDKDIDHEAMLCPIDMFYEKNALCSIVEWTGQDFMLNMSSPMHGRQVLHLTQRMLGLFAYLHRKGVSISNIDLRNFLIHPQSQEIVYFDPDIQRVYENQVPEAERHREISGLAKAMLRLTAVDENPIRNLMHEALSGKHTTPYHFGRALESKLAENDYQETKQEYLAAMSDVGLIRDLNEDNWGWIQLRNDLNLYVVADGMGGHDKGEVAATMAVDVICSEAKNSINQKQDWNVEELEDLFEMAFQTANNSIKSHSEQVGSDMGTTMVAALALESDGEKMAFIANVGDSRAYLIRDETLHQISKDHSLVARMVEQNQITAEQARTHPHSNILLRTVGTERNVSIDIFRVGLEPQDTILLCSDGLWGEVQDEDMESIINSNSDLRLTCRELLRAAHLGGGRDNCTIMLCKFP